MAANNLRKINESELVARLEDRIPEIPDADRLAVATRLAESARSRGISAEETAEAFMILGLHENSRVANALARHGHLVPPAKNPRSRSKAA